MTHLRTFYEVEVGSDCCCGEITWEPYDSCNNDLTLLDDIYHKALVNHKHVRIIKVSLDQFTPEELSLT